MAIDGVSFILAHSCHKCCVFEARAIRFPML
jgi:hypothetical protein